MHKVLIFHVGVAVTAGIFLHRKYVDSEKIHTEGISKITSADFEYARAAGMSIKLLVTSKAQEDGSVLAMVAPFMLGKENPLSSVNDVFNGIVVKGNMLGISMFYGSGAGKLPTASAVISGKIISPSPNISATKVIIPTSISVNTYGNAFLNAFVKFSFLIFYISAHFSIQTNSTIVS